MTEQELMQTLCGQVGQKFGAAGSPMGLSPDLDSPKAVVYVVLEEDRGCGASVAGVFLSLKAAREFLAGPNGSHCYLDSEAGEEVL